MPADRHQSTGNILGWTPSPWHPQHLSSPILHHYPFCISNTNKQFSLKGDMPATPALTRSTPKGIQCTKCSVRLHGRGECGTDNPKQCFKEVVVIRHTSSSSNCLAFTASLPSLHRPFWRTMTQVLSVHKVQGQEFPGSHWKHLRFCNSPFLLKVLNLVQSMLSSFQKGKLR